MIREAVRGVLIRTEGKEVDFRKLLAAHESILRLMPAGPIRIDATGDDSDALGCRLVDPPIGSRVVLRLHSDGSGAMIMHRRTRDVITKNTGSTKSLAGCCYCRSTGISPMAMVSMLVSNVSFLTVDKLAS